MSAKYSWKKIILRTLLVLILVGAGWVVNLIWFKPFSIRLFYDKVFVEYALTDPETVTQLGIPILYGMSKDELTDVLSAFLMQKTNKTPMVIPVLIGI